MKYLKCEIIAGSRRKRVLIWEYLHDYYGNALYVP